MHANPYPYDGEYYPEYVVPPYADEPYDDYDPYYVEESYEEGYYPSEPCNGDCFPCDPCSVSAPICGTDCGLSICSIAAAIAAVVVVAAIIIASPNASNVHSANL